jgi:hypothetical protein
MKEEKSGATAENVGNELKEVFHEKENESIERSTYGSHCIFDCFDRMRKRKQRR